MYLHRDLPSKLMCHPCDSSFCGGIWRASSLNSPVPWIPDNWGKKKWKGNINPSDFTLVALSRTIQMIQFSWCMRHQESISEPRPTQKKKKRKKKKKEITFHQFTYTCFLGLSHSLQWLKHTFYTKLLFCKFMKLYNVIKISYLCCFCGTLGLYFFLSFLLVARCTSISSLGTIYFFMKHSLLFQAFLWK